MLVSMASAKTFILPPASVDDIQKMSQTEFQLRWPHSELPDGFYPVQKGHYVTYQHEKLTYFFGPYGEKENADKGKATWENIRTDLISKNPKFQSSKVGLMYINLAGLKTEGGSSESPSAPPQVLDGDLVYSNNTGEAESEEEEEEKKEGEPEEEISEEELAELTNQIRRVISQMESNETEQAQSEEQQPPTEPRDPTEKKKATDQQAVTEESERPEQAQDEPPQKGLSNGTGFQPSDPSDIQNSPHAYTPFLGKALPSRVDLSSYFPKPGNQGQQGSCVGWATAFALKSGQEAKEERWSLGGFFGNNKSRVFSPAYIYNQINQGKDKGSNFFDALKLVKDQGVATWRDMPYKENDFLRKPSSHAVSNAKPYKVNFFGVIPKNSIDKLKAQLAAGVPILSAFMVTEEFDKLKRGKVWRTGTAEAGYGHAMVMVGYDNLKQAFKVINSWGTKWGDAGYGWIHYEAVALQMQEAWVVKDYDNQSRIDPPKRDAFNVEITKIEANLADRKDKKVARITGTAQAPQGYEGVLKVVIQFKRGNQIVESTNSKYQMADGQAAIAAEKIVLDGSRTSYSWDVFMPQEILGELEDLRAEAVLFMDEFGVVKSKEFKL